MSLWLQAVLQAFDSRKYEGLRVRLMPHSPIPIPPCLYQELEFAERHCHEKTFDLLFPIRFQWLMEAHEQRRFGLDPGPAGRSFYHPEKLLEIWERASANAQYLQEYESAGIQFDFTEKAIHLEAGWIFIGDHFVEDFLEVERMLGVELLFPDPPNSAGQPAFKAFKKLKPD